MSSKLVVVILAAVSTVICQQRDAQCVDHLRTLEAPGLRIDLDEPLRYNDSDNECFYRDMVFANWRDILGYGVNCGSQLTPVNDYAGTAGCITLESQDNETQYYDEYEDYQSNETIYIDDDVPGVPAFNSTSGVCLYVNENYLFSCIICQYDVISYPFNVDYSVVCDDYTARNHFLARLTSVNFNLTTEVDMNELRVEVEKFLVPWYNESIRFNRSLLDDSRHVQVDFLVDSSILTSSAKANVTTKVLNDTFMLSVEDVDFCPSEKLVDKDGEVTFWPRSIPSFYELYKSTTSGIIFRRDCRFDNETFHGQWGAALSRWQLVFRPCTTVDDQYLNEERYKEFLDVAEIDTRHTNLLHNFTSAPAVNITAFKEVTYLVGREMWLKNYLKDQIIRDLVTVTAKLEMGTEKHVVVMQKRAYLIVADIESSDPVVGFAWNSRRIVYDPNESITIEKAPAPQHRGAKTRFAVDVAPRLMEANTRVAFVVLWKELPRQIENYRRFSQCQEVIVMFPLDHVSAWTFMSYVNYYVDFTYFPKRFYSNSFQENDTVLDCVAWNNDLHDWVSMGCEMLYSNHNGSRACRCSGKYFFLHDGVPIGKYALRKTIAFYTTAYDTNLISNFFKGKTILLIATAFECLFSLIGLGLIFSTAIRFKHWRDNKGHKILLHMVLALTCNLVLGFIASFLRMTTSSVGCLVYGVLRHYSFLAMFFWMLVLSFLQLKRLTTVVGAKATSHLILKASLFAWGFPLLPIIILLAVNPGCYQTDRFDRGYCYPERIVFHVTVQGPAGVILLINLGIFIKILLHIFECAGEKKITRHSKGKRAEQLHKLKTSFFIFFLFGFSWVFHIMAEERVIVSDFLYDYLFLMTATTHILALSLFFVVFQEKTRKEWVKVFISCL